MVDMLRTYWKVAQKRFIDNVRQSWDTYFVGALLTACEAQLATLLGLSDATLAHLLVESPVLTKRRTELTERVARLSKAQEEYTRWEETAGFRFPRIVVTAGSESSSRSRRCTT